MDEFRRSKSVTVHVTPYLRTMWSIAADAEGLSFDDWIRRTLTAAARQALREQIRRLDTAPDKAADGE